MFQYHYYFIVFFTDFVSLIDIFFVTHICLDRSSSSKLREHNKVPRVHVHRQYFVRRCAYEAHSTPNSTIRMLTKRETPTQHNNINKPKNKTTINYYCSRRHEVLLLLLHLKYYFFNLMQPFLPSSINIGSPFSR